MIDEMLKQHSRKRTKRQKMPKSGIDWSTKYPMKNIPQRKCSDRSLISEDVHPSHYNLFQHTYIMSIETNREAKVEK